MNSIGQHDYIKLRPEEQPTDGYVENNIHYHIGSFRQMSQKEKETQTTSYDKVSTEILGKKKSRRFQEFLILKE